MKPVLATLTLLAACCPGAAIHAQTGSGSAEAQSSVAASQPVVRDCNSGAEDEIVVCAETERSPYRIPPQPEGFDPRGTVQSVSAERHALYEVGGTGIGSCSPNGPGGWTGCDLIKWKRGYEQRAGIKQDQRGGVVLGGGIRVGAIKH